MVQVTQLLIGGGLGRARQFENKLHEGGACDSLHCVCLKQSHQHMVGAQ